MLRVLITLLGIVLGLNIAAASPEVFLVFDRWLHEPVEVQIARKYRAMDWLRASASAQFSADELDRVLRAIPAAKQDIWVVDLRQESHGFIDGIPVSWYGKKNAANMELNAKQIQRLEDSLLQELRKKKTITVYTLEKLANGNIAVESPEVLVPEQIESEQQLVTSLGANYKRLYVLDHNKPDDATVDDFVYFIKNKVKLGSWLHFHCRGGKGRVSTFIAMYDMMHHAATNKFASIMQRQVKAGNLNLSVAPNSAESQWKLADFQIRADFLKEFYEYVLDPNGYKNNTWSAWQAAQKKS